MAEGTNRVVFPDGPKRFYPIPPGIFAPLPAHVPRSGRDQSYLPPVDFDKVNRFTSADKITGD